MDYRTTETLKRVYRDSARFFIRRNKLGFSLIAFTVVAGALFGSLAPIAVAKIIDMTRMLAFEGHEAVFYIAGYVFLKFLGQIFIDVRWVVINPLLYKAVYEFGETIISKISLSTQKNVALLNSPSEISERTAIVNKMQTGLMGVLHGGVSVILPSIVEIFAVIFIVGFSVGGSFMGYFVCGAIVLFVSTCIGRDQEIHHAQRSYDADNNVLSYSGEFLSHGKLIRETGSLSFFQNKISDLVAKSLHQHKLLFRRKFIRSAYVTFAVTLSYLCVFAWAGFLLAKGAIDAGQIFLLVVYLQRVLTPITGVSSAVNNIHHGVISISAGYKLLDKYLESAASNGYIATNMAYDSLRISKSVTYELEKKKLVIGRGKKIRISGSSGAGKSTFLRSVYRTLGEKGESRPESVHYLSMAPDLVDGSVFENIVLGDKTIDRGLVRGMLRLWSHEFGNKSLDLFDDVKGLSAGEKQWVALIRTLVRRPEFVFLDEATNSLDNNTDVKAWSFILSELSKSTVFIVSHKQDFNGRVDWTENISGSFGVQG